MAESLSELPSEAQAEGLRSGLEGRRLAGAAVESSGDGRLRPMVEVQQCLAVEFHERRRSEEAAAGLTSAHLTVARPVEQPHQEDAEGNAEGEECNGPGPARSPKFDADSSESTGPLPVRMT